MKKNCGLGSRVGSGDMQTNGDVDVFKGLFAARSGGMILMQCTGTEGDGALGVMRLGNEKRLGWQMRMICAE